VTANHSLADVENTVTRWLASTEPKGRTSPPEPHGIGLAAEGFETCPEAALAVIGELREELGSLEAATAWRSREIVAFQLRVAVRQVDNEAV